MKTTEIQERASTRANGRVLKSIGRAIDHTLRLRILELLEDQVFGITVTEIYINLRVEQSVASQHLAILRRAGLVDTERQGKFIYYSLSTGMDELLGKMMATYHIAQEE